MTRQEAVERLEGVKSLVNKYDDVMALREAIKALRQMAESEEQAEDQMEDASGIPAEKLAEVGEKAVDTFFNALAGAADQSLKADAGKLQIHLVPTQVIRDIAEIRMYGTQKYGDPDNWKQVSPVRYRDALARHFLAYLDDPDSKDEESGKKHLKHMACNIAFLCAMENTEHNETYGIPVLRI